MQGVLHVYGQTVWHSDAVIVGNRLELLALAKAVIQAVAEGESVTEDVFVNDGEGYRIAVKCLAPDFDAARLIAPYHDDLARERGPRCAGKLFPVLDEERVRFIELTGEEA